MSTFDEICDLCIRDGLAVVGWFHPAPGDEVPDDPGTLLLLGPADLAMWSAFSAAPEHEDGLPDPLDRWSRRVIGALARQTGTVPLFPFGGPPWLAFQHWAVRGEGARPSPILLQVTAGRGLWASYRGALAHPDRIDLPPLTAADPCTDCPAPCLTACPVDAFRDARYDVPACVGHLQSGPTDCAAGCLARRACPAGFGINLPPVQRAFHMAAFLRANGS